MIVGDEAAHFLRRGIHAHEVDVEAAHELLVVCNGRGEDADLVELVVDELVDVVGLRELGRSYFRLSGMTRICEMMEKTLKRARRRPHRARRSHEPPLLTVAVGSCSSEQDKVGHVPAVPSE